MSVAILKTIVALLAFLIVTTLGLIVWRVGTLGTHDTLNIQDGGNTQDGGPPRVTRLDLAAGCRMTGQTSVAGWLAIRVSGPAGCDTIYIIDPASGRLAGRVTP